MSEKKPKGLKYDREFLVKKIAMMRIKGKSTRFILEFLNETAGIAQTTCYEILRDANLIITEMQDKSIVDAYSEAIAKLEDQYETTSDGKLRLQIQQELNKLQGLYKPNKVDITTNGRDISVSEVIVTIKNSKSDE